jgi:hypothetical protein
MPRRIFIHANNVHQGGGRLLLVALLESLSGKFDWFATLDSKLIILKDSLGEGHIKWVERSAQKRDCKEQ